MDSSRDYHSKSDEDRQISYNITYIWNLKNDTNAHIYKTETLPDFKNKRTVTKVERWRGGIRQVLGIKHICTAAKLLSHFSRVRLCATP